MLDPDRSRSGGEVVPLHGRIDDDEIRLEPPRLERLTLPRKPKRLSCWRRYSPLPRAAEQNEAR